MVTADAIKENLSEPAAAVRGAVMDAFTPVLRTGEVWAPSARWMPRVSPRQPRQYTMTCPERQSLRDDAPSGPVAMPG
jgi:hypothetical protein